jgi:hypothetical protein
MMKVKHVSMLLLALSAAIAAGCSSPAQRMAECEAQGVSKDACYIAEQNKQTAVNAAAEKQALENAQALYPVQKAQSAKTAQTFNGMKLVRNSTGLVVDGKPAALDESNADAKTYSQGLYVFIVYKSGKIAVMQDGKFLGYAK